MTTTTNVTRVEDDYAQQIAGDLAANQSAQEQKRDELQQLQQEIGELEESEKVLLRMQDALGVQAKTATPQPAKRGAKRASVPSARSASATTKKPAKTEPAKATAPSVKAPRTRKTTNSNPSSSDGGVKEETGSPSWLELVTAALAGGTEPRSAAEVTETVGAAHPERKIQAAVIRNTLEQGVARGLLERSKQGRSVYYSPTTPASASAEPDTVRPQP
ncbi:hypothetical protein ACGFZK_36465 [Streptomyces sp. NPDC048257]|uniref:hypothetical protein n=1 Tax=Streptomyces sp. NPDC048257 TaxID=3365526 RepID=UPI00370F9316